MSGGKTMNCGSARGSFLPTKAKNLERESASAQPASASRWNT